VSDNPSSSGQAWPSEIKLRKAERMLEIRFESGVRFRLPAELLRVESPSAEVQGHGASQKITVSGKKNVGITGLEPVGNYAVRILFDDGHDSGLFTWDTLYTLGRDQDDIWKNYLKALETKGLSRER